MGARIESFTIEYLPLFSAEISIKIKPKLKDIPSSSSIDAASVVKDLHQIASLAKSFSDQCLRWGNDAHLADLLDQQGPSQPSFFIGGDHTPFGEMSVARKELSSDHLPPCHPLKE